MAAIFVYTQAIQTLQIVCRRRNIKLMRIYDVFISLISSQKKFTAGTFNMSWREWRPTWDKLRISSDSKGMAWGRMLPTKTSSDSLINSKKASDCFNNVYCTLCLSCNRCVFNYTKYIASLIAGGCTTDWPSLLYLLKLQNDTARIGFRGKLAIVLYDRIIHHMLKPQKGGCHKNGKQCRTSLEATPGDIYTLQQDTLFEVAFIVMLVHPGILAIEILVSTWIDREARLRKQAQLQQQAQSHQQAQAQQQARSQQQFTRHQKISTELRAIWVEAGFIPAAIVTWHTTKLVERRSSLQLVAGRVVIALMFSVWISNIVILVTSTAWLLRMPPKSSGNTQVPPASGSTIYSRSGSRRRDNNENGSAATAASQPASEASTLARGRERLWRSRTQVVHGAANNRPASAPAHQSREAPTAARGTRSLSRSRNEDDVHGVSSQHGAVHDQPASTPAPQPTTQELTVFEGRSVSRGRQKDTQSQISTGSAPVAASSSRLPQDDTPTGDPSLRLRIFISIVSSLVRSAS